MSDERSWLRRFAEDFGKLPEHEPPPLIPQKYRNVVFASMAIMSFVLLLLLVWFVVIPAMQAQQRRAPRSEVPIQAQTASVSPGKEIA